MGIDRRRIRSGSPYEAGIGFSRAVRVEIEAEAELATAT